LKAIINRKAPVMARAMAIYFDLIILSIIYTGGTIILMSGAIFNLAVSTTIAIKILTACSIWVLFSPILLSTAYFTLLPAINGQTMGKIIMGIRVISATEQKITIGQSFLRTTGYFLSTIPFCTGFYWAFFHKETRTWHDLISNTKVCQV
jgi:uncharacterized RDD family membrane protein YckC